MSASAARCALTLQSAGAQGKPQGIGAALWDPTGEVFPLWRGRVDMKDGKRGLQQREVKRGSQADLSLQGHRLLSGFQVPLLHSLLEPLEDKTEALKIHLLLLRYPANPLAHGTTHWDSEVRHAVQLVLVDLGGSRWFQVVL